MSALEALKFSGLILILRDCFESALQMLVVQLSRTAKAAEVTGVIFIEVSTDRNACAIRALDLSKPLGYADELLSGRTGGGPSAGLMRGEESW